MDRRSIARRLGGPAARRRRHRRVAMGLAMTFIAGFGLVLAGSADRDAETDVVGDADDATTMERVAAACRDSNDEIATAQSALLEGNEAEGAVEGFLADAFVDLARARADAIRATAPGGAVLDLVRELDVVVDGIEGDPAAAAAAESNPFGVLNERWVDAGLPDCAIDSSTVPSA